MRHYERIQLNKHYSKIQDFFSSIYKDMVFYFESITPFFFTYAAQLKTASLLLFNHYRRYLALTKGKMGDVFLEFQVFVETFREFLRSGLIRGDPSVNLRLYISEVLEVCTLYQPTCIPNFSGEALQIFESPHDMNRELRLPILTGQTDAARERFRLQNQQNVFEVGRQFSSAGMPPDIAIESMVIVQGFAAITNDGKTAIDKRFPLIKLGSGHIITDISTDKGRTFQLLPMSLVDFLVDRVFDYPKSRFKTLSDKVDGDKPFISVHTNTTFTSGRAVITLDHIIAACNYLSYRESFLLSPLSLRNITFGFELRAPLTLKIFSVDASSKSVKDNSRLTLYYDNRVKNKLALVVMYQTLHYNHDVTERRFHSPISRTDIMPIISENILTRSGEYSITIEKPRQVDRPMVDNNTTLIARRRISPREIFNVAFFMCAESRAIDLPLKLAFA